MGSRRKRIEKPKHDVSLIAVLAAVFLLTVVVLLSQCPDVSRERPTSRLELVGTIQPRAISGGGSVDPGSDGGRAERAATVGEGAADGVDSSTESRTGSAQGPRVVLYLDTSQPMGGFLGEVEKGAAFRTFFRRAQVELLETYGGDHRIGWSTIDERPKTLFREPAFDSEAGFRGSTSNLNLAIEEAVMHLFTGRISAAVVVTDLVPTRQIDGAVALIETLQPLFRHAEVRSGEVDVGLFAARLPYRGVMTGLGDRCVPPSAALGCWLSEDERRWRPLEVVTERPLYLLVLGFSRREPGRDLHESSVQGIGEGLLELAEAWHIEAKWDLLSASHNTISARVGCLVDGPEQQALWTDEVQSYRCQQDARVSFACTLDILSHPSAQELLPTYRFREIAGSWPHPWANLEIADPEERSFGLTIDCGALRADRPPYPELTLAADLLPGDDSGWDDWSTISDSSPEDLGRTLWLTELIESLRPKEFEATFRAPLLREREQ